MLQILWILIKFILIILGILLGLALLAVLLLLFCPVRYRALAVKENDSFKDVKLEARATWLFHAVGAGISVHNGERKLAITLFGVSLETIKGWFKKKDSRKKKVQKEELPDRVKETVQKKDIVPEKETVHKESVQEEKTVQKDERPVITPKTEEVSGEKKAHKKPAAKGSLFVRIRGILYKIIRLPGNLWNKIISLIKGTVKKIKNIKKTVSEITDRIGWWKEFLTNQRTKAALSLLWKDGKGLIRHMFPTKVEGQVTFGCEDPSVTGAALAVLGMTFPFHKNRIQVTPLFDGENQLTGNVFLKGRIYGVVFVKAAIEIYFNKNIKYVINRWKHKED
nr:DUF2953 domain-containing protein [uncultured Blautia sp.]